MNQPTQEKSRAYRSFSGKTFNTASHRNGSRSPRAKAKANFERHGAPGCTTIRCRSYDAYTCQLTLLITLKARSYRTLHLVSHSDSQCRIQVCRPEGAHYTPFNDFIYRIGSRNPFPISLEHLKALEESLFAALPILHGHQISFPVSAEQIELLQPSESAPNDAAHHPTLFLPYNKRAAWATGSLPPTWQADQLSDAKSIFSVAKLLLGLSSPSPRLTWDLPSQQALASYLSGSPPSYHISLCLGIAPMTAELGYEIIHAFVRLNKGQEGRDALEAFFGGPMPLPKPGTSPSTIYTDFAQQRARVCGPEGRHGSDGLVQDPENIFRLDSPAILTRLICCRAETATLLKESCERQWWNTAMGLYDAFLSNTKPISKVERICAFDLYHYRNK